MTESEDTITKVFERIKVTPEAKFIILSGAGVSTSAGITGPGPVDQNF